jgi:23S rRNA (adenine1618-N6)-methyltransferase
MIEESLMFKNQCLWFTTLVSKEETLLSLTAALKKAQARKIQVVEMGQGQKRSRFLAWSFTS